MRYDQALNLEADLVGLPGEDEAPATQSLPGVGDVIVGKYRIERAIREGGMGAVFAAHHLLLDQKVAVKILLAEAAKEEVSVSRFLFEAQAAAKLKSDHVALVMDAGTLANGLPFLVMELLDGCDLGELLKLQGPLPHTELVDYMLQALAGIARAHAAEIIHRDLKPGNLYLALLPDGTNLIKVLDFGISKSTSADASGRFKSLTGKQLLGSPAYMSPEQIRNAKTVDPRSDLWSLGVVMYEMLSGVIPFDGDGVGEILAAILDASPVPLHERVRAVPAGLSDVVMSCLKKDRDLRPRDAMALARALAPYGSPRAREALDKISRAQISVATPIGAFRLPEAVGMYGGPDVPTLAPKPAPDPVAKLGATGAEADPAAPPVSRSDADWAKERTHPSARRSRSLRGRLAAAVLLTLASGLGVFALTSSSRSASAPGSPPIASPPIATPPIATPSTATPPIATQAPSAEAVAPVATSAPVVVAQPVDVPTAAVSSARPPPRRPAAAPKPTESQARPAILRSRE